MLRRTHRIILIASSDPRRLQGRERAVRAAGYYALPASTLDRALALARKVRPAAVLADAGLDDGRAPALLRGLRAVAGLGQVGVVFLGSLTADERDQVAGDPGAQVWDEREYDGDGEERDDDGTPLSELLDRAILRGQAAINGQEPPA